MVPHEFRISFSICVKNTVGIFYQDCSESVDCFWYDDDFYTFNATDS